MQPFTREQINSFVARARAGDRQAWSALARQYHRLIYKIALIYWRRSPVVPLDDLVQEGHLGLRRAVDTYQPEKAQFITYSMQWVRAVVARKVQFENKRPTTVAFDSELTEGVQLSDVLKDSRPPPDEVCSAGRTLRRVVRTALSKQVSPDPRTRIVVAERVLTEDPTTLRDLGERLNISRERIRQIEKEAKARLLDRVRGRIA